MNIKGYISYDNRLPDGYLQIDEFVFNEILCAYKEQGFDLRYYKNVDYYDIYAEEEETNFLIACTNDRKYIAGY